MLFIWICQGVLYVVDSMSGLAYALDGSRLIAPGLLKQEGVLKFMRLQDAEEYLVQLAHDGPVHFSF